eukprot:Awhi_evm1s2646
MLEQFNEIGELYTNTWSYVDSSANSLSSREYNQHKFNSAVAPKFGWTTLPTGQKLSCDYVETYTMASTSEMLVDMCKARTYFSRNDGFNLIGNNLAIGKIAQVSSTRSGHDASLATDGIVSPNEADCYHNDGTFTPLYFTLDLDSDHEISKLVLYWRQKDGEVFVHNSYSDVKIDYIRSDNKIISSFVPDFSNPSKAYTQTFTNPIVARYVNVTVPQGKKMGINELE